MSDDSGDDGDGNECVNGDNNLMCWLDGVASLLLCCNSDAGGGVVALACRCNGDGIGCVGLQWRVRRRWMRWIAAVGLTVDDEGASRVTAWLFALG